MIIYKADRHDSYTFTRILGPAGVEPARVSQVPLTEAILELVKAGLGVSVMARWAIEPALSSRARSRPFASASAESTGPGRRSRCAIASSRSGSANSCPFSRTKRCQRKGVAANAAGVRPRQSTHDRNRVLYADSWKLARHPVSLRTEIIAGITTFFTMSYIVFVNPAILSTSGTGMPFSGVLTATVLVCALMTLLMGLYADLPFGVAPGMGLNAFFTFTIVLQGGVPWPVALGIVFWAGVLFLLPVSDAAARIDCHGDSSLAQKRHGCGNRPAAHVHRAEERRVRRRQPRHARRHRHARSPVGADAPRTGGDRVARQAAESRSPIWQASPWSASSHGRADG